MQIFKVQGMSCGHCARAVEAAVKLLDEDAHVDVELGLGRVTVQSELPPEEIIKAIESEGYSAQLAQL